MTHLPNSSSALRRQCAAASLANGEVRPLDPAEPQCTSCQYFSPKARLIENGRITRNDVRTNL